MNDLPNLSDFINPIPSHILLKWCDEDESRYELLAKAMLYRDIEYSSSADNSSDTPSLGKEGGYSEDLKVWLRSLLIEDLISVHRDSFRKWRETLPPPAKKSETEFFSEELQIAVDISRRLYKRKPTDFNPNDTGERSIQKKLIERELKDCGIDPTTQRALAKIINPYSKKSYMKKK